MKYLYKVSRLQATTPKQVSAVLPQNFSFQEEDGHQLLVVETSSDLTNDQVFNQVQQECDRLFFLTGNQLNPKLVRQENPDGSASVQASLHMFLAGGRPLPPKIDRQQWGTALPVQLRLWQFAHLPGLPIAVQINLLFQIIEISYPNTRCDNEYPQYQDTTAAPDPRTEAKLLRHLASHGKQAMRGQQVRLYCQYLGISEESHDPTDANFIRILKNHLQVVKDEAWKVINDTITRKS